MSVQICLLCWDLLGGSLHNQQLAVCCLKIATSHPHFVNAPWKRVAAIERFKGQSQGNYCLLMVSLQMKSIADVALADSAVRTHQV